MAGEALGLALSTAECQRVTRVRPPTRARSATSRGPEMPTYVYECAKCGDEFEFWQSFSDEPLKKHSGCGGKVTKVLQPVGIVLKGSGFYKTDNRGGSSKATRPDTSSSSDSSSGSSSDSSSDSSSGSSSSTKSDSKKKSDSKPAKSA
jgi:putative FmdB family regulatory protein